MNGLWNGRKNGVWAWVGLQKEKLGGAKKGQEQQQMLKVQNGPTKP